MNPTGCGIENRLAARTPDRRAKNAGEEPFLSDAASPEPRDPFFILAPWPPAVAGGPPILERIIMRSLQLAAVQFTPVFREKEENFARMRALTDGIDADVIVLPELCATGYFFLTREEVAAFAEPPDGPTFDFLKDLADRKNALVAAGFAERDGDRLFNSCLVVGPGDARTHVYRKTHLFYKETLCFDAGDTGFFVVEDPGRDVRVGPMICYDWRFPESARVLTLLGADLIVSPSNLVTDAWRIVMPTRAIENKVYVAVANRAGEERRGAETLRFKGASAVYGYNGKTLCSAGPSGDEVLIAEIVPGKTRDKSLNPINDVLRDRRPGHYGPLVREAPLPAENGARSNSYRPRKIT